MRQAAMKNLLVVEDETLIRLGMKVMLDWAELGVRLVGDAANGKEALEFIEAHRVDIVITDIRMPVMNGMELIRICRDKYPSIRFILLSSYDDFQYAREAILLGVADYILKPSMNVEEMKASLGRILLTFPQDEMTEEAQASTDSQVQQDLLKEHILENALQEEVLKLREEEKAMFRIPYWEGGVRTGVIALQNQSAFLSILFVIVKDHIHKPTMEAVMLRSGMIVVLRQEAGTDSDTSSDFTQWKDELSWKVAQSIGVSIFWDERPTQMDWKQTRRAINEMILNIKLERNEGISEIVQKALEFMAARFQDATIGLEQVADLVGVTPSYFSRLFKHNTGQSFIQHLSKLRVEKARDLLVNSGMTAASVGQAVGYQNPRYFTKWYKAMTGFTPSEYRLLNQSSET